MAAATATMRYASRAAVNGSNAYDLSRSRDNGYKSAASSAARGARQSATVGYATLPRSAYAPSDKAAAAATSQATRAKTAGAAVRHAEERTVRPAVRPAEKAAVRTTAKTARKAQKAYGLSLFAVAGFAVVVVMMVFVLLAHVKYNEITSETVQLQTKMDALNEEERKLKIAYEDAFDINEVAAYATNVLGMTKPTETQVETVQTAASDKAQVVKAPENKAAGRSDVVTFLMSLVAYFK